MEIVLDLDLDFFVWPIAHYRDGNGRLPDRDCKHLKSKEEVRRFLERRCHLKKGAKLIGREFVEHEEAFRVWRLWLGEKKLSAPFGVVHVDAHADLGAGFNSTYPFLTKVLALPVEKRSEPRFGHDGLNSSNYLAFAIANRWIGRLTYVFPTNPIPIERQGPGNSSIDRIRRSLGGMEGSDDWPPVRDLPPWCFRHNDWRTKLIEFRGYRPEDLTRQSRIPIQVEPNVPFELTAAEEFEFSGFTHMVVAQSPHYTPVHADQLLPVIRDYFRIA